MRLFTAILLVVAWSGGVVNSGPVNVGLISESAGMTELSFTCSREVAISASVRLLGVGNQQQIPEARAVLLNIAKQSDECRSEVVAALMKAMDRPSLDFTHDAASYNLWLYGSDILGELQAVGALDLLISHLSTSSSFFSTSMSHQPALRGVVKMGEIAIPKLKEVLLHDPDPRMRHSAVFCIATIGGLSAVHALKEAGTTEADECIRKFIGVSLDSFDDKGKIKDRLRWFSRSLCN